MRKRYLGDIRLRKLTDWQTDWQTNGRTDGQTDLRTDVSFLLLLLSHLWTCSNNDSVSTLVKTAFFTELQIFLKISGNLQVNVIKKLLYKPIKSQTNQDIIIINTFVRGKKKISKYIESNLIRLNDWSNHSHSIQGV